MGVSPQPQTGASKSALLDFAHILAGDHVLVDMQGLHPTSEGKRVDVRWDKTKNPDPDPRRENAIDTSFTIDKSKQLSEPTTAPELTPNSDLTSYKHTSIQLGPFAPEEQISGWVVIDVPDEATAISYAERSPFPIVSEVATIEVRQIWESNDLVGADVPRPSVERTAGGTEVQELCREGRN